MGNEETKKNNQKTKINNNDGETTPLFWEKNKLTVTGWPEVKTRNKILKMNAMAKKKLIFES